MAAHEPNDERLVYPELITGEEQAHFIESFPRDRELTPNQQREWERYKVGAINWVDSAIKQHLAEFERNKSTYPILHDTTLDNYQSKQKEFGQSVPEIIWQPLENAERLGVRKQALLLIQSPRRQEVKAEGNHSHEEEQHLPASHTYEYLDHDPRYHRLITDKVTAWNNDHPDRKITSTPLEQRPDGSVIISAEVLARMPAIETETKERFAKDYEADYARYAVNERKRIYRNKDGQAAPLNDPAYARLQKDIEDQINAGMEKQQKEQDDYEAQIKEKTDEEIAKREDFNKKRHLSAIKYSAKNTDRESVEQEIRTRLKGPNILTKEELEKQARHERLMQFAKDHPEKAAAYAKNDPFMQQAIRELQEEEAKKNAQQRVAQTMARSITKTQTSLPQYETMIVTEEVTAPIIATEHVSVSTPTSLGSIGHSPAVSMGPRGGPSPTQGGSEKPQSGSPIGGAGNLLKAAANLIPQVRAFNAGKKYIKYIIIILIAFFLALLSFLYVLFGGGGGSSSSNQDSQATPVIINKNGPGQVDNGQPIPYTIQVSYDASASDIVVTDPIPSNATFVSASGKYLCDGKAPTANQTCKSVSWNASQQGSSPSASPSPSVSPSPASSGFTFDEKKFEGYGFPPPQNPNPVILNPTGLKLWKQYGMAAAVKASNLTGVDVGIIGFWSFSEGVNYDMSISNCVGHDTDLNTPCGADDWQSGNFAIRPAEQLSRFQEAFDKMYGNHDDATVQKVGQGVISSVQQREGITVTNPATTFPTTSLQDLLNNFGSDGAKRAWVGDLARDDQLGAYIIANIFKETLGPNFADSILYGYNTKQNIINYIKAVYDAGINGSGGGSSFPPLNFTLNLKPNSNDSYVINQASAQVIP